MNTKIYIAALVVTVAIFGSYFFPRNHATITAGSPVGATFNDGKITSVDLSPLTAGATSTSILNTDGSARWIGDFGFVGCTGIGSSYTYPNASGTGLSALLIQAATTSAPGIGLAGNTNYFLNMTVPTSSAMYIQNSTSTPVLQAGYWAPNTYLTFLFNATSTGACVVEVDYIAS